MPNSVNTMIARIVLELGGRSDLQANGVINAAIADAVAIYAKSRFRFNENTPVSPFLLFTNAEQFIYSAADDPRIAQLYEIDYINYLLGSTNNKMDRVFPENIYLATIEGTFSGPPCTWAYDGNAIAIYPAPNQIYQLTIGGFYTLAMPTDPTDTTSPWFNEAERLIRARAKYEIALHVTRNPDMMAMMSPEEGSGGAAESYFNELQGEVNRIKTTGFVKAMKF